MRNNMVVLIVESQMQNLSNAQGILQLSSLHEPGHQIQNHS